MRKQLYVIHTGDLTVSNGFPKTSCFIFLVEIPIEVKEYFKSAVTM